MNMQQIFSNFTHFVLALSVDPATTLDFNKYRKDKVIDARLLLRFSYFCNVIFFNDTSLDLRKSKVYVNKIFTCYMNEYNF